MIKASILAGLAAAVAALPAAAETHQGETITVWEIDYSGRPPFERRQVEVPVADAASLESSTRMRETVTMRVVDYSGRPPFRRSVEEVPVVDAASLEEQATTDRKTVPRPFYKQRHR